MLLLWAHIQEQKIQTHAVDYRRREDRQRSSGRISWVRKLRQWSGKMISDVLIRQRIRRRIKGEQTFLVFARLTSDFKFLRYYNITDPGYKFLPAYIMKTTPEYAII